MSSDPGAVTSRLFDVRGSRAVVTGAASGLGLAIAEVLADCGARVTLADIDAERLDAAAAALAARGGGRQHGTPGGYSSSRRTASTST